MNTLTMTGVLSKLADKYYVPISLIPSLYFAASLLLIFWEPLIIWPFIFIPQTVIVSILGSQDFGATLDRSGETCGRS